MAIICSGDDARNQIALTFDDGPLIPYTEQILDAFDEHQARATFFVRGGAVTEGTSRLVMRAHEAGHEIGNHTQNHLALAGAARETIAAEISATHGLLVQLLGSPPLVIRPPYGRGCADVDWCASAFGYHATVLWNISPRDWSKPPAETIVSRVLAGENPDQGEVVQHCRYSERSPLAGAIVLLHDGCAREQEGESRLGTVKAVRSLIPDLQSRGLELVTISELLEAEG